MTLVLETKRLINTSWNARLGCSELKKQRQIQEGEQKVRTWESRHALVKNDSRGG